MPPSPGPAPSSVAYPPVNFHFRVVILSSAGVPSPPGQDASFQEISGISAERATEPYHEGGRNEFPHRLPGVTRYPNLVLRRGVVLGDSPLFQWCLNCLGNGKGLAVPITAKDVRVELLTMPDAKSLNVLKTWILSRAWPVKWELGSLNSLQGEVLLETLELTYDRFTVN